MSGRGEDRAAEVDVLAAEVVVAMLRGAVPVGRVGGFTFEVEEMGCVLEMYRRTSLSVSARVARAIKHAWGGFLSDCARTVL